MRRLILCLAVPALLASATPASAAFTVRGEDGAFRFTPRAGERGRPCLDYETPAEGGGRCFIAVGSPRHGGGGWALEAEPLASDHDVVFYGVAIRRAAKIRIGKVATLETRRWSRRHGVRFFAGTVPRRALTVPRNRIVALDAAGELLGRQHWDGGNGGSGRCDGSWDRVHHCPGG